MIEIIFDAVNPAPPPRHQAAPLQRTGMQVPASALVRSLPVQHRIPCPSALVKSFTVQHRIPCPSALVRSLTIHHMITCPSSVVGRLAVHHRITCQKMASALHTCLMLLPPKVLLALPSPHSTENLFNLAHLPTAADLGGLEENTGKGTLHQ